MTDEPLDQEQDNQDDQPTPPASDDAGQSPSGDLSQPDIDAALSGQEAAPDSPPQAEPTGELSQADIDAALGGQEAAATPASPTEPTGELSQADIDAALAESTHDAPTADPVAGQPASAQNEIDAVLAAAAVDAAAVTESPAAPPDTRLDSAGRPFDEAAVAMAAAIEEDAGGGEPDAEEPAPQPVNLPDFSQGESAGEPRDISILRDVNLRVHIELGRSRMYIEDVLKLSEGSVVELDSLAGDPVDVYVNDRLIARGEVLVLGDNFCVRISEIVMGPQNVAVA